MNHPDDPDIDALLRAHFDGPVPDDGFADRVMRQPRSRRRRAAWPVVAGIVAGIGASWLSLWTAALLQAGWRDWIRGEPSASDSAGMRLP
jgi:hypothetical protein